ncbi:response regulator transcription factor [Mesorhizobium japonicum]|uniref:response regulator transcription factor n=1 Tax=Mesorhizobium japonicum TaxID=2066070 RepID=UPI003B5BE77D
MSNLHSAIHIAIVEDDTILREELHHFLANNGFQVSVVNNGISLNELLTEENPDLIIVDINLPGENGHEIAKRVRSNQPGIGIITLTARTSLADRVKSYDSGADIYLPKPTAPEELLAAILSLIRRYSIQKLDGALTLDTMKSLILLPNGDQLPLTRTELILLKGLIQAPNHYLESSVISELLGGSIDGNGATKRALENTISRLRKKIAPFVDIVDHDIIKSARGSGYQLCIKIIIYNI